MNAPGTSHRTRPTVVLTLLAFALAAMTSAVAFAQSEPAAPPASEIKAPQPTVPEVFTIMGQYVRVAYNNEGYVVLGYRTANGSKGDEWMLLDVGVTLRRGVADFGIRHEAFSVRTPDGQTIPLATQQEYAAAHYLPALNKRDKMNRDSLNYFPVDATKACGLQFFSDLGGGNKLAYEQTELTYDRACVGRLFFKIPGGIKPGQYWLDVQFATSKVETPFRILTAEEEKTFKKTWQDLKKQLDAQFESKTKKK